jgi:hypothetical protein
MENIEETSINPSITIEWDTWNETWVINRSLIYSERLNVPVSIKLQPGSMTVILDLIGHAADIIEVASFVGLILLYIRKKAESKNLPQPILNSDAAVAEAINKLTFFEKRDISNFKVKSIRKIDNGYEIIFTDSFSNIFRFEIYQNGEYEYSRI